jgi:hypothetical protein
MSNMRIVCPECGCLEMDIDEKKIVTVDGPSSSRAKCPACSWEGPLAAAPMMADSDAIWDTQRAWQLILVVATKHAAGPMIQALEFLGYVPKLLNGPTKEVPPNMVDKHNKVAAQIREDVSRAMFEGMVASTIEASIDGWKKWKDTMGTSYGIEVPKGGLDIETEEFNPNVS